jgi:hypothetical protein
LNAIASLNPINALHSYWRQSSPEAYIAVGGSGFVGWLARVDWAAVLSFAGLAAMVIGGTTIELIKRWRIMNIEVSERQRKSNAAVAGDAESHR